MLDKKIDMKQNAYTPQPIFTEDIILSDEILHLSERIAQNVHDVWAASRVAEGWTWGEKRDEVVKQHPCLIPYDELPESEKEYDRQTAMQTLKLIQKFGFTIQKNNEETVEIL